MKSNALFRLSIRFNASEISQFNSVALSARRAAFRLSRMQSAAFGFFSTKTASFAPRLKASIPIAPLPLNKSRNVHP